MFLVEAIKPKRIASIHAKRPRAEALKAINANGGALDKTEQSVVGINCPGIFVDPRYVFSLEAERKESDKSIGPQKFISVLEPSYPRKKPPVGQEKITFSATNRKEGVRDDDLCFQLATAVAEEAAAMQPRKSRAKINWSQYTPYLVMGNHCHLKVPTVHYALEKPRFSGFQGFSLGDWGPVAVEESVENGYQHDGNRMGSPVYTVETFGYAHSGAFASSEKGLTQLVNRDGNPTNSDGPPIKFDPVAVVSWKPTQKDSRKCSWKSTSHRSN